MIKECPVNYLCKVVQTIPIFDFTMFIGEIVVVYANEDCLENGTPNALEVKPTIMMYPGYYSLKDKVGTVEELSQQPGQTTQCLTPLMASHASWELGETSGGKR